ncbi:MAG: hypothetical protein U9Q78_05210 [Chloroflexota bacterium]|nr:hypothetical protein [Chloroflexota bacterium]
MQHVKGAHFDLGWSCLIPLWLACAIWATVLIRRRGHPTWKGLLVGLTLGPIGILWALTASTVSVRRPQQSEVETVPCRFCGRPVSPYAPVCPHCGRRWPSGHPGE